MGPSLTNFPLFSAARLLTLEPVMFVVVVAAVHILAPPRQTELALMDDSAARTKTGGMAKEV